MDGIDDKVKLMNDRLKKFAIKNNIDIIQHDNINESCLSRRKLHLNKKGNSYLANNFIQISRSKLPSRDRKLF